MWTNIEMFYTISNSAISNVIGRSDKLIKHITASFQNILKLLELYTNMF